MSEDPRWRISQSDIYMVLGVVVLGCAILGYENAVSRKTGENPLANGTSGFNMRALDLPPAPPAQLSRSPSGLDLIKLSDPALFGNGSPTADKNARKGPEHSSLKETALRSGAKVSAFTADFKRAHPIMREYSREWLKHPDLKKLNDDYMRDRDQVKFLHGLAASRSFGPLVAKFASEPSTHALAMEFVTGLAQAVPGDLTAAAAAVLNGDHTIYRLVGNIAEAFGVPSAMLSGLTGGTPGPTNAVGAKPNGAP